jgi:hypothetical protein
MPSSRSVRGKYFRTTQSPCDSRKSDSFLLLRVPISKGHRMVLSWDRVEFCHWNRIDNELTLSRKPTAVLILLFFLFYYIPSFSYADCDAQLVRMKNIICCVSSFLHQQFSLSQTPRKRSSCYNVIKQTMINSIDSYARDIRNGWNSFCSHFTASLDFNGRIDFVNCDAFAYLIAHWW